MPQTTCLVLILIQYHAHPLQRLHSFLAFRQASSCSARTQSCVEAEHYPGTIRFRAIFSANSCSSSGSFPGGRFQAAATAYTSNHQLLAHLAVDTLRKTKQRSAEWPPTCLLHLDRCRCPARTRPWSKMAGQLDAPSGQSAPDFFAVYFHCLRIFRTALRFGVHESNWPHLI